MKLLQVRLTDDEHRAIKIEAAKRGVSIKDYVMSAVQMPYQSSEVIKTPRMATKSTAKIKKVLTNLTPDQLKELNTTHEIVVCKGHSKMPWNCGKVGCKYEVKS